MNANVHQALSKQFEASRIAFWNDVKCELRSDGAGRGRENRTAVK